jgi:hypothetical protein
MPQQTPIPAQGRAERRGTRRERREKRDANQRGHRGIAREGQAVDGLERAAFFGVGWSAQRRRSAARPVTGAVLAGENDAGECGNRCPRRQRSQAREAVPGQRVVPHEQEELMRYVGDSVHGRGRREQNAPPSDQPGGDGAIPTRRGISEPVRFIDDHRPKSDIRHAAPAERFVGRDAQQLSRLPPGGDPLFAQGGGNERMHRPSWRERECHGDADVRLPGSNRIGEDRAAEPSGRRDGTPERERLIGAEPRRRRIGRLIGQERARQRCGHARRRTRRSRTEPRRQWIGDVPERFSDEERRALEPRWPVHRILPG